MISTFRPCHFSDACNDCISKNKCISATKTTYEKRMFILSLTNSPNYTLETKELFKKGIENHERLQKELKTVEEYTYKNFRRDILRHKKVILKEVKICSPTYALHGVVDILAFDYDKEKQIKVLIDEIKSNYSSRYYFQLMTYAVILSDPLARIIIETPMKRKPKNKRILQLLYPAILKHITINGRIFLVNSDKEQPYWEMVAHNQFFEGSAQIKKALEKRLSDYKDIMLQRSIDLTHIPQCKSCNYEKQTKFCGWRDICNKYEFNIKSSQYYMSSHKIEKQKEDILIKTKPKLIV